MVMIGWKKKVRDWSLRLIKVFKSDFSKQRKRYVGKSTEPEEQPEKRLEKIRAEEVQEDFMITPPNKYAVTETGQIIRLPERNKKRHRWSGYNKEPRI
jgi:hypothetical protein